MAEYVNKPGQFSIFKNDRKEKDSHPDYKGSGKDLSGDDVWISCWLKDAGGKKFFSCSMQKKETQKKAESNSRPAPETLASFEIDDSDIPF